MKTRLKVALSAAIFLVSLDALSRFLHWMNQPSDFWLYAGALSTLALAVLAPAAVALVWRADALRHKRP